MKKILAFLCLVNLLACTNKTEEALSKADALVAKHKEHLQESDNVAECVKNADTDEKLKECEAKKDALLKK